MRRKREEVEGVRSMGTKVREMLAGFGSMGGTEDVHANGDDKEVEAVVRDEQVRKQAQRSGWESIDEVQ